MQTPALSKGQILARVLIVLFCVWHMFAVFIFTIPRDAKDSFAVASRAVLIPYTIPYIQSTSQWQLWDVFAPEPLREIFVYQIQKEVDGEWEEIDVLKPGTYPFWQHANHFKYLTNVINNATENMEIARDRFLETECKRLHVPEGTHVRVAIRVSTLPYITTPMNAAFWNTWAPEWERRVADDTFCPAS